MGKKPRRAVSTTAELSAAPGRERRRRLRQCVCVCTQESRVLVGLALRCRRLRLWLLVAVRRAKRSPLSPSFLSLFYAEKILAPPPPPPSITFYGRPLGLRLERSGYSPKPSQSSESSAGQSSKHAFSKYSRAAPSG
ncbi:hypothetical protein MRX96_016317 [Rhipicephalus microplus]